MFKNINPQFCIQALVTLIVLIFCMIQLSKDNQADKSNYFLLLGNVIGCWLTPPSVTKKEEKGEVTTTTVVTPGQVQTQTTTQGDLDSTDFYHSKAIAPPDDEDY